MPKTTPERKRLQFWKTVTFAEHCWLWNGCIRSDGRGFTSYGRERKMLAHRLAWELTYGPIPEGVCVCHRCDNPRCVRPDHLFLGTQQDNLRDMRNKDRGAIPAPRQGSKHHKAKLTEADVLAIRQAYAEGETQIALARRYGVTGSNMCSIVNGKTWTHLRNLITRQ
jgi:hypothetical protein